MANASSLNFLDSVSNIDDRGALEGDEKQSRSGRSGEVLELLNARGCAVADAANDGITRSSEISPS